MVRWDHFRLANFDKEKPMERNEKVEKAVLTALSQLLKDESITLRDDIFVSNEHSVTISASLPNQVRQVALVKLWSEWSDTYIFFVGDDRGLYLRWINKDGKILISLNHEMTDKPEFVEPEMAWLSLPFQLVKNRLVREISHGYYRLNHPAP